MIDFAAFSQKWMAMISAQAPTAQEEVFRSKLSRLGVKAPFGTPPAEMQLAKAAAKAQVTGNFMGEPLQSGINNKLITAQVMVDQNVPLDQAKATADQFYKSL